ncbi:caspase family protein [Robiginitalea biformata]|uniref:Peptidase C14, caspase catalytic subunit p20 n=1 Tax=Robiginitalea biformata (strain ATCC BAA-864 / DSM 15991 / KCTC 12146 / HTCC2501) TaxID=313596 RepID=A4CGR9_ROBBH|nr:caspase family protein [Robiginitalea biformata]EAR16127.1 Peptidase C14, caspase catalytic subunit p20 [Robiginitalea biformata HTCC2501]
MDLLQNAHALLIGISYEDGLDTIGDAEDVARILRDPERCGYPPGQVTLLTGADADRKGILGALEALAERTDEQSSVFLYYSGHGDVLDGVFHFVPHGIREGMEYDEYTAAWVTAEEIRDRINALSTRRLIFFMDCCHATGIASSGFRPKIAGSGDEGPGKQGPSFEKLEGLAQKVDNEKGISIVASCKEEQESYQLNGDKNSVFTKYLLEALEGNHLTEVTDPYVRILEVAGYLLRVVPETIEQVARDCDPPLDIRQEPYVNLEMYDNFILSRIPGNRPAQGASATVGKAPGVAATDKSAPEAGQPQAKEARLIYRETPGANNLILFIHGFTGEASRTFGSLPDLLMDDPEFDGWDMKPFGYSQFIEPEHGKQVWGGIRDIQRIVDYFCTSVKYKFADYDRIAIVAHGLGGLVAQKALLQIPGDALGKISHLVLMGCPSHGLAPEEFEAEWHKDYAQMRREGPFISGLRKDWDTRFGGELPFSLSVIGASSDTFVSPESCFGPFPEAACVTLDGDHFSIVRPDGPQAPSHRLIREFLTGSEALGEFGDAQERNLALGRYEAVVRELGEDPMALSGKGIKQLVFALEGLDRRDEAMKLLDSHPEAERSTDLMGIIGGRYKRAYLRKPNKKDGETAQVYYGIALDAAREKNDSPQVYYLAINLAFLALVVDEDRDSMQTFARLALEAAENSPDSLWKTATLGEAALYLGDLEAAQTHYALASSQAGIREKLSIHLNALAAYCELYETRREEDAFIRFLKAHYLS